MDAPDFVLNPDFFVAVPSTSSADQQSTFFENIPGGAKSTVAAAIDSTSSSE